MTRLGVMCMAGLVVCALAGCGIAVDDAGGAGGVNEPEMPELGSAGAAGAPNESPGAAWPRDYRSSASAIGSSPTQAWLLVQQTAEECDRGGAYVTTLRDLENAETWRRGWYVYDQVGESCEDVLIHQENLVCVAGKLVELAASREPIEWREGEEPGPRTPEDRIVARELALNVLGHAARLGRLGAFLDGLFPGDLAGANCRDQLQSLAAATSQEFGEALEPAFGIANTGSQRYTEGVDVEFENAQTLVDGRLEVRAQLYADAGRLFADVMRTLVDDSVALAGSHECDDDKPDPWGISSDELGRGRHLLSLLWGRLELSHSGEYQGRGRASPSLRDRACHGAWAYVEQPPKQRDGSARDLWDLVQFGLTQGALTEPASAWLGEAQWASQCSVTTEAGAISEAVDGERDWPVDYFTRAFDDVAGLAYELRREIRELAELGYGSLDSEAPLLDWAAGEAIVFNDDPASVFVRLEGGFLPKSVELLAAHAEELDCHVRHGAPCAGLAYQRQILSTEPLVLRFDAPLTEQELEAIREAEAAGDAPPYSRTTLTILAKREDDAVPLHVAVPRKPGRWVTHFSPAREAAFERLVEAARHSTCREP